MFLLLFPETITLIAASKAELVLLLREFERYLKIHTEGYDFLLEGLTIVNIVPFRYVDFSIDLNSWAIRDNKSKFDMEYGYDLVSLLDQDEYRTNVRGIISKDGLIVVSGCSCESEAERWIESLCRLAKDHRSEDSWGN